jgi:hypothetical protein
MSLCLGRKFFSKHNCPRAIPGGKAFLEIVVVLQTTVRIRRDTDIVTVNRPGFEDVQIIKLSVLHGIRGNGGQNGVETKKGSAAYSSTSFLCGSTSRIRTCIPTRRDNSRMLCSSFSAPRVGFEPASRRVGITAKCSTRRRHVHRKCCKQKKEAPRTQALPFFVALRVGFEPASRRVGITAKCSARLFLLRE